MKNKILELVNVDKFTALTVQEIYDELQFTESSEFTELVKELNSLEEEGFLFRTKKDRYDKIENQGLSRGKLSVTQRGFGFVDVGLDKDVYIDGRNIRKNGAINKDTVLIEIINYKGTKKEGKIVKIVSRDTNQIVGVFRKDRRGNFIDPDNKKMNMKIRINNSRKDIIVNYFTLTINFHFTRHN